MGLYQRAAWLVHHRLDPRTLEGWLIRVINIAAVAIVAANAAIGMARGWSPAAVATRMIVTFLPFTIVYVMGRHVLAAVAMKKITHAAVCHPQRLLRASRHTPPFAHHLRAHLDLMSDAAGLPGRQTRAVLERLGLTDARPWSFNGPLGLSPASVLVVDLMLVGLGLIVGMALGR